MTDDLTRRGSPMTTLDTANYIKRSVGALKRMRQRGEGPKFKKKGRFVIYHPDDVDAWLWGGGVFSSNREARNGDEDQDDLNGR